MATKLNVPLFDEEVDAGNPSDSVMKFVGMVGGAALAIAAIGGGQYVVNEIQGLTGNDSDDSFEVI